MQTFVERARQALGVGPSSDAFLASSLEAQETTLSELDVFAPTLQALVKATERFSEDTRSFLEASAAFTTAAPFPRVWMQGSPAEPATAVQTPVPAEHTAWFDASVAEREAAVVPGVVSYALRHELLAPMQQWLWAWQVAQGHLGELQGKRLGYDAERRRLVQRATAATSAASQQQQQQHTTGSAAVQDPAMAQLAEDAAAINRTLSEFESDAEALDDLLHWLVEGAVRLKALLADTAGLVGVATSEAWAPTSKLAGLMPPFPEKSSFGESLEVSVTLSDAPRLGGLAGTHTTEQVVAAAAPGREQSSSGGVTTIASLQPHHTNHASAARSHSLPDTPAASATQAAAEPSATTSSSSQAFSSEPALPEQEPVSQGAATEEGVAEAEAAPKPGSIWQAIQRTVAEAGSTAAAAAASVAAATVPGLGHDSSSNSEAADGAAAAAPEQTKGPQAAADEAVWVQGPTRPVGEAAAEAAAATQGSEGRDSAVLGPVTGSGGGGTGPADSSAPPTLHIGPLAPAEGPTSTSPAPGSAEWTKGPTPPGGAAAGDEAAAVQDAPMPEQGKMHIGPMAPESGPADPAPGSAVWVKEATPPGGAAAPAAAPAGSEDKDPASDAGAAETAAAAGLDLSRILPAYEHGVPEPHSKPEGGSFSTFVKDTLLGPKQ